MHFFLSCIFTYVYTHIHTHTQIRALEAKNVLADKEQREEFEKYQKPIMVLQVAELEAKVSMWVYVCICAWMSDSLQS